MRKFPTIFLVVIAIVVILDQLSKWIVRQYLTTSITIFQGFSLSYVTNSGAGFGILQNQTFILSVISIIVVVWLTLSVEKVSSKLLHVSYALIVGGAIGNLIDRVIRKAVTDFITIWPIPSFNVADSAITIGAVLLLYDAFTSNASS